jgi:hypothetical protein
MRIPPMRTTAFRFLTGCAAALALAACGPETPEAGRAATDAEAAAMPPFRVKLNPHELMVLSPRDDLLGCEATLDGRWTATILAHASPHAVSVPIGEFLDESGEPVGARPEELRRVEIACDTELEVELLRFSGKKMEGTDHVVHWIWPEV